LNGATGCDVETVTVTIAPRACENPWEAQRASLSRDDDVRAVMAYALERQATVLQATARLDANDAICDDSCDCPRGDVIDLAVAPADRAAVVAVFGSIVRE
jgi:hypothetical protein